MRTFANKLPEWMRRVIAFCTLTFWLPCPVCRREFGGWEPNSEGVLYNEWNYQMRIPSGGFGVCCDCTEESDKINQSNYAARFSDHT